MKKSKQIMNRIQIIIPPLVFFLAAVALSGCFHSKAELVSRLERTDQPTLEGEYTDKNGRPLHVARVGRSNEYQAELVKKDASKHFKILARPLDGKHLLLLATPRKKPDHSFYMIMLVKDGARRVIWLDDSNRAKDAAAKFNVNYQKDALTGKKEDILSYLKHLLREKIIHPGVVLWSAQKTG